MSFGIGASDFIATVRFSWTVYRACKNSTKEFQEISKEVNTLHTVLKELEDEANNEKSTLNRKGGPRKKELLGIIENVETVLKELEDIVTRYENLGRKEKRTWDRVRFATEDLQTIRDKLTFHIGSIGLFMDSLMSSSLSRIESVLEEIVKEVRKGKRDPTIVSIHESDDLDLWRELESELAEEGISKEDVERHKNAIKIFLKGLIGVSGSRPSSHLGSPSSTIVAGNEADEDDWNWDSISLRVARKSGTDGAHAAGFDDPENSSEGSSQANPHNEEGGATDSFNDSNKSPKPDPKALGVHPAPRSPSPHLATNNLTALQVPLTIRAKVDRDNTGGENQQLDISKKGSSREVTPSFKSQGPYSGAGLGSSRPQGRTNLPPRATYASSKQASPDTQSSAGAATSLAKDNERSFDSRKEEEIAAFSANCPLPATVSRLDNSGATSKAALQAARDRSNVRFLTPGEAGPGARSPGQAVGATYNNHFNSKTQSGLTADESSRTMMTATGAKILKRGQPESTPTYPPAFKITGASLKEGSDMENAAQRQAVTHVKQTYQDPEHEKESPGENVSPPTSSGEAHQAQMRYVFLEKTKTNAQVNTASTDKDAETRTGPTATITNERDEPAKSTMALSENDTEKERIEKTPSGSAAPAVKDDQAMPRRLQEEIHSESGAFGLADPGKMSKEEKNADTFNETITKANQWFPFCPATDKSVLLIDKDGGYIVRIAKAYLRYLGSKHTNLRFLKHLEIVALKRPGARYDQSSFWAFSERYELQLQTYPPPVKSVLGTWSPDSGSPTHFFDYMIVFGKDYSECSPARLKIAAGGMTKPRCLLVTNKPGADHPDTGKKKIFESEMSFKRRRDEAFSKLFTFAQAWCYKFLREEFLLVGSDEGGFAQIESSSRPDSSPDVPSKSSANLQHDPGIRGDINLRRDQPSFAQGATETPDMSSDSDHR